MIIEKQEQSQLSKYEDQFIELIANNREMMHDLYVIRELHLPGGCIAAGYVRNYIWDCLHGFTARTALNDIDVIYYNKDQCDEEFEKNIEQHLREETGSSLWSVKNQARMHIQNGDRPYQSISDAMSYWPETVTAVAIRLEADNRISYESPYGLDDLFEFRVRQSPLFKDEGYYQARINKKSWKALWPRLDITGI
jgi:hypothetical protein